jgi:iron complex outermembrane receptor protein
VTYDLGARYATKIDSKPVTFRAAVLNASNKAY